MKKQENMALLVVDHSANRSVETIRSLRSAFACEVLFAHTPADTIAILRQRHPPVAVVASGVRVANGMPIARFIQEISPQTGVIAVDEQAEGRARSALSFEAALSEVEMLSRGLGRRRSLTRR